MKKTVIVNIYNFIRMSHTEPSRFIQDDFETIKNQLIMIKQYGFPGTYALKYDALMDERYQELLREYLDDNDELSAWWEITEPLCRRAGVVFRGHQEEEYDDRVDSAYCIGYWPEERKKLLDAYMEDFHAVFDKYPATIGSWVLDSVTVAYAAEKYGLTGACICRDQMGTDGFTLWGGWPNGLYYPSRKNAFLPAQTEEEQINIPVFRLLGPDPIYNFEADVRDGLQGVYTLEPSWLTGRNPEFINWLFEALTQEDTLGIGYAHVGQENNFLWENISPGFVPQLSILERLYKQGRIRVETMESSAIWFRKQYRLTPPVSFQASRDWDEEKNLSAQWYASANYRLGFLGEEGHLRIRDLFLYDENYPCRYLNQPMKGTRSFFDALPVLFPQLWGGMKDRPYIRLMDEEGMEPQGEITYDAPDQLTARARLSKDGEMVAEFILEQTGLTLSGENRLCFDRLPVWKSCRGNVITMEYERFIYGFTISCGKLMHAGTDGIVLLPEEGKIRLTFGVPLEKACREEEVPFPVSRPGRKREVPLMAPKAMPSDSMFPWGSCQEIVLLARDEGQIYYTTDGSEPTRNSMVYENPVIITSDTCLKARLFTSDGQISAAMEANYIFGWKDMILESPTKLDSRPVFCGGGIRDLLKTGLGSLDFLDGQWRGSLQDVDIIATLPEIMEIESIGLGFLSHHRSGIIFPASVELYVGPDQNHLKRKEIIRLPEGPCSREIAKRDVVFQVNEMLGAFRVIARRYEKMPGWCCYRGDTHVFTMVDHLAVFPKKFF